MTDAVVTRLAVSRPESYCARLVQTGNKWRLKAVLRGPRTWSAGSCDTRPA